MANPPSVNRQMIEGLLDELLANPKGLRMVLVHGHYDSPDSEFTATLAKTKRRVRVTNQDSVLGIVEAVQQHQKDTAGTDDVLVVTTGVEDSQLGWDVRAHAIKHATRTVHPDEIVKHRFGAVDIDPRIRNERWLLDALLKAEPAVGWRRVGGVLTRDAAMSALVEARVGAAATGDGVLDMAAVLEWSRTPGATRFGTLDPAEQAGVAAWLGETVGEAAPVVLRLATEGRTGDAMPLGVLGSILEDAPDDPDVSLAIGGLLPGIPRAQITHLARAVQDTLVRWVDGRKDQDSHGRVLDVVRRADELAAANGLTERLAGSRFALSGFQARLRKLAEELTNSRKSSFLTRTEAALAGIREHALAALLADRVRVAEMAVRLGRWLAEPDPAITGVAGAVREHLAEWGWVDRALAVLWAGDDVPDPVVAQAYRTVYQAARDRRATLDEGFAKTLASWVVGANSLAPGGSLLIEDVLASVAVPLAAHAPVVIVLDAMSSAVAVELGDELAKGGWLEASPKQHERVAAVAMVPSVTTASRASLLTGRAVSGGKSVERAGFRDFWRGQHSKPATLLHSADIAGDGGHRLSADVLEAFAGNNVVGIVLNTIDDALDHGREGERTSWHVSDITYLPELLDTARMYRRPIVLVADHGHVLERSPAGTGPATVDKVESARWHTGTAGDGEVELIGPRVLYGNGRVVVPWREDIRYVKRHAGYHGGATLAEMTVPVLVLLPDPELLPSGWSLLPAESVTPPWWEPQRSGLPADVPTERMPSRPKKRAGADSVPLFQVETKQDLTLGERVVASERYATQKAFVRKPPDPKIVTEIIDAFAAGDGRMSLVAVAAIAGRAGRIPDAFAATLQRLLNVESYPVFGLIDSGRTARLDLPLLREQFGLGEG